MMGKRSRTAFRRDGGAALIIAIGILTILLIIGLTFFQMAQREMTAATNTGNQMRAELMAEGATAVAIAFLNHDLAIHPSYTSLDHAWRTYFNGAWAVGKDWAWQNGVAIVDGGLPIVDPAVLPDIDPDNDVLTPNDEPLFTGVTTADSLYYPRIDDIDPNVATQLDAQTPADLKNLHEFVVATALGDSGDSPAIGGAADEFRPDQIAQWTDVDNDGDTLNDSIWIPVAADQITFLDDDGEDNNGINGIDEEGEDDGIDNDLDGIIDNPEGEVKVFLYNGATDGLNNDGDLEIDEADEDGTFLTAHLFFQRTPAEARIQVFDLARLGTYDGGGPPVVLDVIDNDYNLVIGNNVVFVIDPTQPESPTNPITIARAHYRLDQIAPNILTDAMLAELGPNEQVWGSAEPVSDIVGRMAILITDEASKVNLNTAGGHIYNEVFPAGPPPPNTDLVPAIRSMGSGIGPHEYDTRVLPQIGVARTRWMWQLLTGSPDGFYGNRTEVNAPNGPIVPYYDVAFEADATLPGYGFVDDNGNALWWLTDGIDNDGNGFIDDGLIPYDYNGDTFTTLAEKFEGIDEPQEHLKFSPLRNRVAEGNAADNDGDDVDDERGEMGDRYLRTYEQSKLVNGDLTVVPPIVEGIDATTFDLLRNLTTVHSNDRNNRYRHSTDGVNLLASRSREVTGLKLDYNYAMAEDIAKMLRDDFGFSKNNTDLANSGIPANRFSLGLLSEDTEIPSAATITVNPDLRVAQFSASIRDYRDRDHVRSEVETKVSDAWWEFIIQGTEAIPDITYTSAGVESIRINEIMVRPVRRIEAEMKFVGEDDYSPQLDPNRFTSPAAPFTFDFNMMLDQVATAWTLYDNLNNPPYIGMETMIGTTEAQTVHTIYGSPNVLVPDVPNVVQFGFEASNELPAGRYYLTINTLILDANGDRVPSVTNPGNFEFTVKYVSSLATPVAADLNVGTADVATIRVGATSIVEDVIQGTIDGDFDLLEDPWQFPILGYENMDNPVPGTESGWAFLSTNFKREDFGIIGSTNFDGYFQNEAYTIEIFDPADFVETQIGIRIGPETPPLAGQLAINFFDFSQEPDHEWVELVNIAEIDDTTDGVTVRENAIDLSGWQLVVEGEKRRVMTIPNGTFIAPGGYLLLGMNLLDTFRPGILDPVNPNLIFNNGIGLGGGPGFDFVTIPPVPPGVTSVFDPPALLDFVDNDGDGVEDFAVPLAGDPAFRADDLLTSTLGPGPANATDRWDRIIELDVEELRDVTDPVILAKIVLSGGIFPNYPEHDGIDNDGDNLVLVSDLVSNDGDREVDEVDEGIDEGRWVPSVATAAGQPTSAPGSYTRDRFHLFFTRDTQPPGTVGIEFDNAYTGSDTDPPEQKAFNERRWFPGDNVIVTLYERTAPFESPRIADRITYSERDIVNRSIDDILDTDVDGDLTDDRIVLDDRFPTFWPDDTMGIDFYKSLERKHPLYAGDRFGTQNRWQATDGNYDDWSDRTSAWERVVDVFGPLPAQVGLIDRADPDPDGDAIDYNDAVSPLFGHTFNGSPLRMNLSQRLIENPIRTFGADATITADDVRQFKNDAVEALTYANLVRWAFDRMPLDFYTVRSTVRNRTLVSPANLLRMPHFRRSITLDVLDFLNASLVNQSVDDPTLSPFRQDTSTSEVMLGQRELFSINPAVTDSRDISSVIGAGATSAPLVLTTGQADVIPFIPLPGAYPAIAIEYSWGPPFSTPNGWTPVLTYFVPTPVPPSPLPVETFSLPANYDARYLLQTPGTLPITVDNTRSPVESRAVMYASGNIAGFLQTDPHAPGNGAESFFLWDGADGLENGEYDLYLSIGDDLSAFSPGGPAEALLFDDVIPPGISGVADFGVRFIASAAATLPEQMEVDVEVYTDRNRNGNVYDAGIVDPTVIGDLDATESFGQQHGLAPGPDGFVHYGTVRIENNVLGLMLRNRTPQGSMIRFSRVILTPRDRTPGRININTTITRDTDGAGGANFNSLMGLPGVLGRPGDADPVTAGNSIFDIPQIVGAPVDDIEDLTRSIALHREIGILGTPPADAPADGRYFQFVSDLVSHRYGDDPSLATQFDNALTSEAGNASAPDVFDELKARLERMQNLITVRSDVFEILVTVQAGYGVDVNGDGIINYRDNDPDDPEFVVTATRTARTIYER